MDDALKEWVVDMEKKLNETHAAVEKSQWERPCIYRVPASIKELNPKAYRPQVVSLGPFHHDDEELRSMEEHKHRALLHRLQRTKTPLPNYVLAVEEVAEELEGAYQDLDDKWRCVEGRGKFLQMMIVDGCFLLEVMEFVAGQGGGKKVPIDGYAPNDPIFSRHAVLYVMPFIRRDMLMLENQLPMLLLKKLVAVETASNPQSDDFEVKRMVLRFLQPPTTQAITNDAVLGLHPLDVYRLTMLLPSPSPARTWPRTDGPPKSTASSNIMRSAVELYEAGVRFRRSATESFHNIQFHSRCGVLSMPPLSVDDSTEYTLLNLMAFERLHVDAGNDVTAYVFFMDGIINSAKDVELLCSKGFIQNALASDKAVAKLFNNIAKDVVLEPESPLDAVHRQVNAHCMKPWNAWRAHLVHTVTYFQNEWAFLTLLGALLLGALTITQTLYTVLQFYQGKGNTYSAAPAPK